MGVGVDILRPESELLRIRLRSSGTDTKLSLIYVESPFWPGMVLVKGSQIIGRYGQGH